MAKKKKTTYSKKKAAKASRSSASKKAKAKKAKVAGKTKKRTAKKSAVKKSTVKKSAVKKSVAKKKAATKKSTFKKSTAKISVGKNTSTKKAAKRSPKKSGQVKAAASKRAADTMELYEEPKIPKTKLTDKQLKEFRQLLIDKRRELLGDVRMLTRDALGKSRQESSGDLSNVPIHMADVGSDNWEQDFTIGLIANERQLVREIDDALERIEDRTYGVCLGTLKRIAVARLRAKPWAKYSIEYARELEQRRG